MTVATRCASSSVSRAWRGVNSGMVSGRNSASTPIARSSERVTGQDSTR